MAEMHKYEIVIMGSGDVGKSALLLRYVNDDFLEEYGPTIEDTFILKSKCVLEGTKVTVNITDTGGQEEFGLMEDGWIQKGQGFILVYDITREEETFQKIKELVAKLRQSKKNSPILLVGNKADQPHNADQERAKELAKAHGCTVLETSAKDGRNVDKVFETMVIELFKAKKLIEANKLIDKLIEANPTVPQLTAIFDNLARNSPSQESETRIMAKIERKATVQKLISRFSEISKEHGRKVFETMVIELFEAKKLIEANKLIDKLIEANPKSQESETRIMAKIERKATVQKLISRFSETSKEH